MTHHRPFQDLQPNLPPFNADNISISPESKQTHHSNKLFSSPFHVGEFTQLLKPENFSPDLFIQFSNSFRRIMEKQNQQSEDNEQIDVMGNRIHEFDSKIEMEVEEYVELSPIEQDKENQRPTSYLNTPLKIKRNDIRSPLQDITPSMTHKKKKTNSKLTVSEKTQLLTPRTMQKSGLASSGLRKIQRF